MEAVADGAAGVDDAPAAGSLDFVASLDSAGFDSPVDSDEDSELFEA